jgi:hypothetical protein
MHHAPDIVAEHVQQDFVELCREILAPNRVTEHAFDRAERCLDVAALVVVQEFFAIQREGVAGLFHNGDCACDPRFGGI